MKKQMTEFKKTQKEQIVLPEKIRLSIERLTPKKIALINAQYFIDCKGDEKEFNIKNITPEKSEYYTKKIIELVEIVYKNYILVKKPIIIRKRQMFRLCYHNYDVFLLYYNLTKNWIKWIPVYDLECYILIFKPSKFKK
ncbi:MAG: hypothetical protein ACOYO1_07345 [Bacteroidales bacterium]